MAFKMNFSGFKNVGKTGEYHDSAAFQKSALKDAGHGGELFHMHDTPERKAQRDLDAMAAGSRRNPDGTRKKGKAKKEAKEMRKWTGLDQQKYDREAKREKTSFRGKEGQEGLDKLKKNLQKKNKKSRNKSRRKGAKTARKAVRSQKQSLARTSGAGCQGSGCGAYE